MDLFRDSLEAEVDNWCEAIRANGCESEDSIEELKDHLLCEIERLKDAGSTDQEALVLAIERIGGLAELTDELNRTAAGSNSRLGSSKESNMASSIDPTQIALFSRQLSTMMKAGVPVVQSLTIVEDATDDPAMKNLILSVRTDVSGGETLADALRTHPDPFDSLYCDLVAAGEKSGYLEAMLDRIATYKEKTEGIRSNVRTGMKYSIAMVAAAFTILLVEIAPTFGLMLIAAVVVAFLGYREIFKRSTSFRDDQVRLAMRLPVIGDIIRESCVARLARTLATTFAAGVGLVDALESVCSSEGNVVYRNAFARIRADVSKGMQLNHSMKETGLFPNLVISMVSVGEESGSLDVMLDRVATYYEEVVANAIQRVTSLMQPMIIALLCGVIIYNALTGG